MADSVTSQTIMDGSKTVVMKFTNISDGTGETAVVKADASALLYAPSKLKVMRVWAMTNGMAVNVLFDATADVLAVVAPADEATHLDFRSFGGVNNNAGSGVTGDIAFTTVGASAGDSYSIVLELSKS
jgi:hypothetical protein